MSAAIEDVAAYNGHHEYAVCNESIPAWRDVLEGVKVDRAAGISSGGEVAFFAILPVVKTELILVDHTYQSLCAAVAKYNAVDQLTAKKAWELCTEHREGLNYNRADYWNYSSVRSDHGLNKYLPDVKYGGYSVRPRFRLVSLAKQWESVTVEDVARFKRNRKKISFLHGDIKDLKGRGEFDLLYLSNALDYVGRNGAITTDDILQIVKPGGYVLSCYTKSMSQYAYGPHTPGRGVGYGSYLPEKWERVAESSQAKVLEKYKSLKGYDSMGWKYELVRRPA